MRKTMLLLAVSIVCSFVAPARAGGVADAGPPIAAEPSPVFTPAPGQIFVAPAPMAAPQQMVIGGVTYYAQPALPSTGIPWLDRLMAFMAALALICSLLAHIVPPTSVPGKLISWIALNFGRQLKQPPPDPETTSSMSALLVFLGVGLLGVAGCTALRAAERASPDCYGIQDRFGDVAHSLTVIFKDISQSNPVAAAQQLFADRGVDGPAAMCLIEEAENLIRYPHGGEAAYAPDAGPVDAGSPLANALLLNRLQLGALEQLEQLKAVVAAKTGAQPH
jgi:hypothetical protein